MRRSVPDVRGIRAGRRRRQPRPARSAASRPCRRRPGCARRRRGGGPGDDQLGSFALGAHAQRVGGAVAPTRASWASTRVRTSPRSSGRARTRGRRRARLHPRKMRRTRTSPLMRPSGLTSMARRSGLPGGAKSVCAAGDQPRLGTNAGSKPMERGRPARPRLPQGAPVPDGRTVLTAPDAIGADTIVGIPQRLRPFIPDTNPLERFNREIARRTDIARRHLSRRRVCDPAGLDARDRGQ